MHREGAARGVRASWVTEDPIVQRQVVTQAVVQDSKGSTVWREGGCSQSRFWGKWWGSGSRFVP